MSQSLPVMEPTMATLDITGRIGAMDTSLFDAIPSQTNQHDRRTLLAIQAAVASRQNPYRYLEIGSHLGGSIQPYLLDPRCAGIVSIDKRPERPGDERDALNTPQYLGNSSARMMANLKELCPEQISKITTIDGDTGEISVASLPFRPNLCFIDGEHVDASVFRDFEFCLAAVTEPALIFFHDAEVIFRAIRSALDRLNDEGRRWRAYHLPTSVFVIELGEQWRIHQDAAITEFLFDNHDSYLAALEKMAQYRDFYNRPEMVLLRRMASRLRPQIRLARRLLGSSRG